MKVLRLMKGRKGASPLGPLETRIMEILWDSKEPLPVRDVVTALASRKVKLAYSTVKAVLTNLAAKGRLRRSERGNTNYFAPSESREEFQKKTVSEVIDSLLVRHREPMMAHFVDRVAETEDDLRLMEELIAKKRAELASND